MPSALLFFIFAVLAFHTLAYASALLIPIHLALLANLALSPVVRALERIRIPAPLGAALTLAAFLFSLAAAANLVWEPAAEWLARAPESLAQIERKLRTATRPLEDVSRATESVEKLVDLEEGGKTTVEVDSPGLLGTLLSGTQSFLASGAIVVVLLYFLLADGDGMLRRLVAILPIHDRLRAIEAARRTEREISRYLFTICLINLGLALVVAAVLHLLEMPNAVLWGAITGALNFVPFLGPSVATALVAGASILSFDTMDEIVGPPVACMLLTSLEGLLVTPMLLGRRLTLTPAVIFLAILTLSWTWGIIGALVAVPTLVLIKAICDEVEALWPLGVLLEADPRPSVPAAPLDLVPDPADEA